MINTIQMTRGIAAFVVVCHHIAMVLTIYGGAGSVRDGWDIVFEKGGVGVDLFFVVSGVIMMVIRKNYIDDTTGKRDGWRFITKRVERIGPPLWIYTTLALAGTFLIGKNTFSPLEMMLSYLLVPINQSYPLIVAWSLVFEWHFYLLFALTLYLTRSIKWQIVMISIVFGTSALVSIFYFPQEIMFRYFIHPLYGEFIAGILIGALITNETWRARLLSYWQAGLALIVVGFAAFVWLAYGMELPRATPWRLVAYGLPSALCVLGLLMMEQKIGGRIPKPMMVLGNASYSLYLSHVLVLHAIGVVWRQFGLAAHISDIVLIILCLGLSIGWAVLTYDFVEKGLVNRVKAIVGPRLQELRSRS